jgi:hypothetical protein
MIFSVSVRAQNSDNSNSIDDDVDDDAKVVFRRGTGENE